MNVPEKPKTEGAHSRPINKSLIGPGLLGMCAVVGFLYALFMGVPNLSGGKGGPDMDFAQFRTGSLQSLEVLATPPALPQASFTGPEGGPATLADKKGKVILVNLWATWCAPCVTEMPTLAKLHNAFKDRGFEVIAVSVDRPDTAQKAKTELARLSGKTLTFYHDPQMAIVFPMKARGFPTSVLYDRQGRELARLAGEADWSAPEAKALIEAALTPAQ
jgi:thiol-disulfide isomerase/thioredoxin